MERATAPTPTDRRPWSDIGLAFTVILAVPLAMIVEGLGVMMVENSATAGEMAILGLFALPLVTGWAAIALSLAMRPLWVRLGVAALLLLVPPLLLLGVWHA